jgi:hypothetical protein
MRLKSRLKKLEVELNNRRSDNTLYLVRQDGDHYAIPQLDFSGTQEEFEKFRKQRGPGGMYVIMHACLFDGPDDEWYAEQKSYCE